MNRRRVGTFDSDPVQSEPEVCRGYGGMAMMPRSSERAKPGGRFAVSDVVIRGEVPSEIRRSLELRVGCVAGAVGDDEYGSRPRAAGFTDVEVERSRVYQVTDARHSSPTLASTSTRSRRRSMERSRAARPAAHNCEPWRREEACHGRIV